MSCEHYKQDLIEAAATGGAFPNDANHHVEACARCSVALAEEQTLLAAIDAGMHKIANSELPPSFLTRVQASLSAEPVRKANLVPAWAILCAGAALAAIVGLHGLSQRTHNTTTANAIGGRAVVSQTPGTRGKTFPSAVPFSTNSHRLHVSKISSSNADEVRDAEQEVLVPPGEEALLLRFYETVRAEPHSLPTVAADDASFKPLNILRIDVPELKIDSLEQRDSLTK